MQCIGQTTSNTLVLFCADKLPDNWCRQTIVHHDFNCAAIMQVGASNKYQCTSRARTFPWRPIWHRWILEKHITYQSIKYDVVVERKWLSTSVVSISIYVWVMFSNIMCYCEWQNSQYCKYLSWKIWNTKVDWEKWVYGHLRNVETEEILYRFSRWLPDCQFWNVIHCLQPAIIAAPEY